MELDYLKSKDLSCVRYGDRYRTLSKQLNQDFDAIIAVLSKTPLCVEGQEHVDSRNAIARLIASRLQHIRKLLPDLVNKHFAILDAAGTVDMMKQVFDPLVHELWDELAGFKLD
jgi:hypothetical protein